MTLIDDAKRVLSEKRIEIGSRVALVLLFPTFACLLARGMGYYDMIPPIPIDFLYLTPFSYQTVLIGGTVMTLTLFAALAKKRGPAIAFLVAAGILFWLGFPYSRLRWYRLLPGSPVIAEIETPGLTEWILGALLLATATAFALADGAARARDAYRAKSLAPAETAPAVESVLRGGWIALATGVGAAAALALLYWAVAGGARGVFRALPRVNPVFGLLALGIGLAILVAALARGRKVATGDVEPFLKPKPRMTQAGPPLYGPLPPPPAYVPEPSRYGPPPATPAAPPPGRAAEPPPGRPAAPPPGYRPPEAP